MKVPLNWQITDVWVSQEDDIYVVGAKVMSVDELFACGLRSSCGFVGHYDGRVWREVELPHEIAPLGGIWGTDNGRLHIVGAVGNTLQFDGTKWNIQIGNADTHLVRIWGIDDKNIFAVGAQHIGELNSDTSIEPTILRFDGETWNFPTPLPNKQNTSNQLQTLVFISDIGGTSLENMYISGSQGIMAHYNGNTWTPIDLNGNTRHIYALAVASEHDVIAVGQNGSASWYHNNSWHEIDSDIESSLIDVVYAGDNYWFAVSDHGDIIRFDGQTWSPESTHVNNELYTLAVIDQHRLIAAGSHGTILLRHGSGWKKHALPERRVSIRNFHTDSDGCLYAAAGDKIYVSDPERTQWTPIDGPAKGPWHQTVWGKGCGDEIYTNHITNFPYGGLARLKDDEWTLHETQDKKSVSDIWASDDTTITGNTINNIDISKNNLSIQVLATTEETGSDLRPIWGLSGEFLYVGGGNGVTSIYNGEKLVKSHTESESHAHEIWGIEQDTIFVTSEAGIDEFDGINWKLISSPHLKRGIRTIWGVAPDAIFAGGTNGLLVFYDGEQWSPVRSPTREHITAVWASGWPGELFIGNSIGEIYSTTQFAYEEKTDDE
ncbi:MAG: hypothetical protein Tsb0020_22270 [Haliangiales bacterium]